MVTKQLNHASNPPAPLHARCESILQRVADRGTFVLLVFAPLWMGGRHPVGRFLFVGLICLIAVTSLWQRALARQRVWYLTGIEWLLLATGGVIAFQLIPLPHAWLVTISPTLAERLPLWTSSAAANLGLGPWNCVSLHPDATRSGLAMFTAYALLFLITAQRIREAQDIRRIVRWVAAAAVLMATVGLAQLVFGNGKFLWVYAHPTREAVRVVRGAFANQNHMAHLLALGIGPLVWWLSSYAVSRHRGRESRHETATGRADNTQFQNDRRAILLVTGLGLVLLAGVLTFSRGCTGNRVGERLDYGRVDLDRPTQPPRLDCIVGRAVVLGRGTRQPWSTTADGSAGDVGRCPVAGGPVGGSRTGLVGRAPID